MFKSGHSSEIKREENLFFEQNIFIENSHYIKAEK
jgi:hypothetical protein